MSDTRPERGLFDTSVVIDLLELDNAVLPVQAAISTIALAELTAGLHAAEDPAERARRQDLLQWVESSLNPLPFDSATARAFGLIYAEVMFAGRKPRGHRAVDLLIAATALSHDLPLFTRNPSDFSGLQRLIQVVPV